MPANRKMDLGESFSFCVGPGSWRLSEFLALKDQEHWVIALGPFSHVVKDSSKRWVQEDPS